MTCFSLQYWQSCLFCQVLIQWLLDGSRPQQYILILPSACRHDFQASSPSIHLLDSAQTDPHELVPSCPSFRTCCPFIPCRFTSICKHGNGFLPRPRRFISSRSKHVLQLRNKQLWQQISNTSYTNVFQFLSFFQLILKLLHAREIIMNFRLENIKTKLLLFNSKRF